jgi:hypothetical protein
MTPQVKVFTLAFDEAMPGFDDGAVADFVGSHAVTEIRHEFFYHLGAPWLLVLIHWRRPVGDAVVTRRSHSTTATNADDRGQPALSAEARERFERLRKWRTERARLDGVSHFVILTNRQLAAVAEKAPASLAALLALDGIGQGKLSRYGADLLAVLHPSNSERAEVADEPFQVGAGATEEVGTSSGDSPQTAAAATKMEVHGG